MSANVLAKGGGQAFEAMFRKIDAAAQTGQALIVDTTWRLLRLVSTQTVQIPPEILRGVIRPSGQTKPVTKDQVSDPSAATTAAAAETTAQRRSLLYGLATATGAL